MKSNVGLWIDHRKAVIVRRTRVMVEHRQRNIFRGSDHGDFMCGERPCGLLRSFPDGGMVFR
jgi:hypothetical protein